MWGLTPWSGHFCKSKAGNEGRRDYRKLGGEFKIAHMFELVKGEFTRFL